MLKNLGFPGLIAFLLLNSSCNLSTNSTENKPGLKDTTSQTGNSRNQRYKSKNRANSKTQVNQLTANDADQWGAYGGSVYSNRYSGLEEINSGNVNQLKPAWTYHTRDMDSANHSEIQCNPVIVDGILYGTSAKQKLFALDASNGKEKWVFDPLKDPEIAKNASSSVTRGVIYWESQDHKEKRIYYGAGSRIFCIDAFTGKTISFFGHNGNIDLHEGLDRDVSTAFVVATSPGVIYKNLLITGMRVAETADAAPGHIRAFDIHTGKRKWIFHTIPFAGEKGYGSWEDKNAYKSHGGVNSWPGMSLDPLRGIVYIPLGSASYDFWGGDRKGNTLYANSILALDAATGKYLWHFQTIHHDLWDKDLPANPNLITITQRGKKIAALAQISKSGLVYMFDRMNGKPIFPIREIRTRTDGLPGEAISPSQPIPVLPEPFTRQVYSGDDLPTISKESRKEIQEKIKGMEMGERFIPPSKKGHVLLPGFDGGAEWGGAAVDTLNGIMFVNANEIPWTMVMMDVPKSTGAHTPQAAGHNIYNQNCIACHGVDLKGDGKGSHPSLVNIGQRMSEDKVSTIISTGRNMMPSFKQISPDQKKDLLAFLFKRSGKEEAPEARSKVATMMLSQIPYVMTGYNRLFDNKGYPGIKPPWGTLNAIDLNSGKLLWKTPLGEYPELSKQGIPKTGTENYGGPLVTRSGLVFIAASRDAKFRAFDAKTGSQLWEDQLPAAGFATPATYRAKGKQFIVIAAGGGKSNTHSGDAYVAYALP